MLGVHDLALFIVSGLLLNITPGQDVAYIVSRSAAHGLRDGSVAALGIGAGCFVHVFAAALGLSAILATSATAFLVVKLAGAAYLVWIGAGMLLGRGNGRSAAGGQARGSARLARASARKVFTQGFLTNALNPKVALFFLAFLPQFVDAGAGSRPLAFLLLGVIFTVNGTLVNLLWAWSAARLSTMLGGGGRFGVWIKRAVGALFVGFGVRLALAD
ncbi:LysE family translocator [Pseudodesulfovibrio sp. F-1]|uniref:LysE family translocator n=1 Tax=Pseudodesulfovibrio alkaliphilus TaxID=2661613 RepID=A0A7K1KNC9_9BACT|nr:LysE family translocator [Pseudodesulfovibrio alkaliphilus]MUM77550.1 LysE family translocator [Pseudodesulfovibrio alkaliphilus]